MHPTYASVDDRPIVDILSENKKFPERVKADSYILALREVYACVKVEKLEPQNQEYDLVLWIRGYGRNPDEHKNGILGSYAGISIVERGKNWVLTIKKVITSLGAPHSFSSGYGKAVAGYTHPSVKHAIAGTVLKSYSHGVRILDNLEDEYPTSTIRPYTRKLFIYLWNKKEKSTDRKVMRLVQSLSGDWRIALEDSIYSIDEKTEGDLALLGAYRKQITSFSKELSADE